MILFWDLANDTPEILDENGDFHSYYEDIVAIRQNLASGRGWFKLDKLQDVTAINTPDRFEIYDELIGDWIKCTNCSEITWKKVMRLARIN